MVSQSTEINKPTNPQCCKRKTLPTNGVNWKSRDQSRDQSRDLDTHAARGPSSASERMKYKTRQRENYERLQFNKGTPISTVQTPAVRDMGTNIRDKSRLTTTMNRMSKQEQYDKKWFEPPKCCSNE
jgi:hypothetical protein